MPVTDGALTSLLREVSETETALAAEGDEQACRVRSRLTDSVARPLRQAAGTVAAGTVAAGTVAAGTVAAGSVAAGTCGRR